MQSKFLILDSCVKFTSFWRVIWNIINMLCFLLMTLTLNQVPPKAEIVNSSSFIFGRVFFFLQDIVYFELILEIYSFFVCIFFYMYSHLQLNCIFLFLYSNSLLDYQKLRYHKWEIAVTHLTLWSSHYYYVPLIGFMFFRT